MCKAEVTPNLWMKTPESVHYVVDPPNHSKNDVSEYAETAASDSLCDLSLMIQGRYSPPPSNVILAEARNERRYRLLLEHQFHPSRMSSISFTD